ncbi:HD domain-containing protein [Sphingobium sp. AP50]|uniref:HD domain-containing protein n=1 Tax=Sphingobium sp. AP50 TaxID=1884369 RepID=UPI0008AB7C53|nr:HD domain-containing protein [Sphingobium sp. AP50]SEK02084.1 HD domain-containing protein [Sphingobium sp. AP50]
MTGVAEPDDLSDRLAKAWSFAACVHNEQKVPGSDLPYLKHLGSVVMEILTAHALLPITDLALAATCAILHDAIEDQAVCAEELAREFGQDVADGVSALSKNLALPKAEAMADSLARIGLQPSAIWCVKLADRITNLRGAPSHWSTGKIEAYRNEAGIIHDQLGPAHAILADRLRRAIARYPD